MSSEEKKKTEAAAKPTGQVALQVGVVCRQCSTPLELHLSSTNSLGPALKFSVNPCVTCVEKMAKAVMCRAIDSAIKEPQS